MLTGDALAWLKCTNKVARQDRIGMSVLLAAVFRMRSNLINEALDYVT